MNKVFKIPDGKGGIRYRVQTPDGIWHDTDEKGNILSENPPSSGDETAARPASSAGEVPKDVEKGREKSATSHEERRYVNFSIQIRQEDYKMLSDYVHWRSLFKEECSKGGFLLKLALDTIRKDREFRDFLKNSSLL
mgnify:CR=1 FL=1